MCDREGKYPSVTSLLKTGVLAWIMGVFATGRHGCRSCWCWKGSDDVIPFWFVQIMSSLFSSLPGQLKSLCPESSAFPFFGQYMSPFPPLHHPSWQNTCHPFQSSVLFWSVLVTLSTVPPLLDNSRHPFHCSSQLGSFSTLSPPPPNPLWPIHITLSTPPPFVANYTCDPFFHFFPFSFPGQYSSPCPTLLTFISELSL